jgi:hypothetical protein
VQGYELRLRRLVEQAFELRESPYYKEALEAIVELHERRLEIRVQEAEEMIARLDPFIRGCLLASLVDRSG